MNIIYNSYFCRITSHFYLLSRFNSSIKRNLNDILLKMPKEVAHTATLKNQRLKLKEKNIKYTPSTVTLQVLGSGAYGAPRSLYLFTDQTKYLFNCGEGTQRLAHEHKMKLSKLEHIFITYPTWENIGGLPGVALTIQDVGVPQFILHGPSGIDELFESTRKFVVLRDLTVKMAECKKEKVYQDNVMKVHYVPIYNKQKLQHKSVVLQLDSDSSDDDVDYYAYAQGRQPLENQMLRAKRKRHDKNSDLVPGSMSMAYICRLNNRPGTLLLEACVEHGVPPGPLLGRLKAGEDVTLKDGRIVRSIDVKEPDDPGAVFIVVECPSEDFLDSLLEEESFSLYQTSNCENDIPFIVVHFTPSQVMLHPRYKEWMSRFQMSTHHLIVNESNSCMGSVAVHRIQCKLNILDSSIFPLLCDQGLFKNNGSPCDKNKLCEELSKDISVCKGETIGTYQLRPLKSINSTPQLTLSRNQFIEETVAIEGLNEELAKYKEKVAELKNNTLYGEYPKIVFLGTGSCIPNKTRNTSGILLHMSASECMLLDCGEATFGQLVRYYGVTESENIFKKLVAIYVSHLHADHHIGLIGLLKARTRATLNHPRPLYLFAPKQIMKWLNLYNFIFEHVLEDLVIVPLGDLDFRDVTLPSNIRLAIMDDLHMMSILTCPVNHCLNSFGVALRHNDGWKITYSGDTMPCDLLTQLGEGSDLLIHEATMEDELENEAKIKMHSTTSQAIKVGQDMNAKFTLLTHFSQRYSKLPRFNDIFSGNVGIAFDNMEVDLNSLQKLPLMYPVLKLMFAEHYEELEQKAFRRQLKQSMLPNSPDP
uniref:Zinc phosphodiesterase ELAC protein 2 n=1 Tax=Clastoptera arizonana TaxID=38151 RepID=A0A1B6E0U4_9HEMI